MGPSFVVSELIQAGRLEPILTEWSLDAGGIWALYPHRRRLSAKVRAFIELLQEGFADPPWRL